MKSNASKLKTIGAVTTQAKDLETAACTQAGFESRANNYAYKPIRED